MSEQVLQGRYEIDHRIGLGGMAEVYLGKDRLLGRTVAIKTLLMQFADDPSFIARFKREATSAAALNHPNIVSVYDTGADEGRHFIVMEYIDGRTLKDVIREEGPLLPERAAELAAEVCSALQFAHAHGIVHRDVKPANIMLNTRGELKVADFGIARAASGETVTQTATVLGTAQYFSPEQAQAAPVDARSDLYSLGVVLYEMLTRQVPFSGATPVAIAFKHVKEDPIPPSRLNADVPPSIEAVVMRALSKNPDNRYQSAQEMRQDIERAIRGLPVDAPRVMTPSEQTAVMTASSASDDTVMLRAPARSERRDAGVPQPSRRGLGIGLLALIGVAMVGIIIWALIALLPDAPTTVRVPEVAGLKLDAAQRNLRLDGFTTRVAPPVTSSEVVVGTVIRTEPPAGTAMTKGGLVTIFPSGGRKKVEVPSVIGSDQATAEARVKALNLNPTVIAKPDNRVKAGNVISQSPAGGTQVEEGATVTLTVSSGKESAIVPNVIGDTEADAIREIQDRKLKVRVLREPPDAVNCSQPSGRVCRQTPEAGTQQPQGSEVVIVVATEEEPPPTESPSPAP